MMKYGIHDERIFNLLSLGFSVGEIATVIDESETFVKHRKIVVMLQRGLILKDINEAQQNKLKTAGLRRDEIDRMASFNRDVDVKTIENHMEYTRAQLHLGKLEYTDAKTLGKAMLLDVDFITWSNVQIVLTGYTRNNKLEQATNFLGNCIDVLDYNDNRRIMLDRARGVIDNNIRRRKQNREMIRRMEANENAKTSGIPKQDTAAPQRISGWEH